MNPTLYTDYDNFAWFYNRYWSERLIKQIYWTIEKYLLDKLKPGSRILDLCCGNGHLAALMTERGFEVTGIDSSAEMLRYARENAPTSRFQVTDARSFSFTNKFDAVLSTCDSLNHIMKIEELQAVFNNVRKALSPGGYFLFDMNTEEGYQVYWTGEARGRVEDDNAFIAKFSYDKTARISCFEVTMFRLLKNQWHRFDTRATQRYYPVDIIMEALNKTGFVNINVYDVEKDLDVAGTGRVMFVMQKG